ncbi:acyltransferase family protein [Arthrobacter sp. CAN_C5]|uniref:acyltransferase family protein n=1 Tax=Arthrobacter sp. CAN_C5 TaxID=2760706 RepID=UPI001FD9798C|nr:peptidoglycan/LPS O-acetylase OafA/YrhL [Arthrobacter sp. CAN_C5]
MRAVAVGAVVLYHAGLSAVPGGYVGVDIFFVISGFLITGQLISMLEARGRIPFGEFYAKRIRRIIPASFVVLALTTVASLVFLPPATRPGALQDAIATALYVPNVLFAAQGADYLAETAPSPFQHYWSLGVEEQFYLFWPLLLLLGFLLVRRSTRRLFWVVLSIVVLSFALCIVLTGTSQPAAFFLLPTRAWELGIGALAAFALHSGLVRLNGRAAALGTWLGMAGIAVSLGALNESTVFPGWAALLPVLSTAAVIVCGSSLPSRGAGMLLSRAPMQKVGAWSYSIYLVHWPLLVIPQAAVGYENPLPLVLTLALGALSVPLAVLLYRYVENRFRHPAAGSPLRARRVIATAALASLGFVAVAAGAGAVQSTAPIASTREAASQPLQVAPNGSTFVPANLNPTLRDAPDSIPGTYDDGCHADFPATEVNTDCVYGDPDGTVDIVLFGDSHAAQWFPALEAYATDGSYRLHNLTKSSCPSVDIEILHEQRPYSQCEQWRQSAVDYIDALDPAVVVLSNYGEVSPVDTSTGLVEQWEAGLGATLAALPGSSHALVLADTPSHSTSPLDCLSRNIEEAAACDLPRAEALDGEVLAAEERAVRDGTVQGGTVQDGNASFVDLSSYLCTDICPSIIGDLLVYRDEHHMTTAFSRALAGPLGDELDKVQ